MIIIAETIIKINAFVLEMTNGSSRNSTCTVESVLQGV